MNKRYIWLIGIILLGGIGWYAYSRPAAAPTTDRVTEETILEEDTEPVTPETPSAPAPEAEEEETAVPEVRFVDHVAPFTSQAPTGEWEDQRQQDGCEEASALMAMRWVEGAASISADEARREIIAMSDFEQNTYGEYRDVSLEDLRDWIFLDYFKYDKVEVKMDIRTEDIIAALMEGAVVIAPMNGQKLGNPYFSGDGPERHMLLIRGYDPEEKEFITNDPGTRRGEGYRYTEATVMNAILAYPTGYKLPADENEKGILIVRK